MKNADSEAVMETIRNLLATLVRDSGIDSGDIRIDTSLVDDLALDSLSFVDLTLAIEDSLGLEEFPMQAWADAEGGRASPSYTVRSLVEACLGELQRQTAASLVHDTA
jgi:acyl carrier protein